MNDIKHKIKWTVRGFLFVIYLVGMTGISIPALRGLYVQLTPYTLLLSALVLFVFHNDWSYRFIIAIMIIAAGGFFVEVLGVQTGSIFGTYAYGPVLGPQLWEVPLIIAVNWLMLIYISYIIAAKILKKTLPKLLVAAFLMVFMDVFMEPVAIILDMWNWYGTKPPIQNYVAWLVIAFLFAGLLHIARIKTDNPVASYLYVFLIIFFGVLSITL